MKIPQNYNTTGEFIERVAFDYFETYSLQRGAEFEDYIKSAKPEYNRLKVRKEKRNNLTEAEESLSDRLHRFFGYTQYIISDGEKFHFSAQKTNTIKADTTIAKKLITILKTEIIDMPAYMCAPIYRDAIVLYDDNNNIINTLNICLSCKHMETNMHNYIKSDVETYVLLKQFFIDLGHNVEL